MWEIGRRLRARREAEQIDIGQVAEYEGLSKAYVSQLETGKNKPNWDLLARFARRYKTSTDYILGLTDNPLSPPNGSLPEGAQELIDYLSSMSSRGREQLLKIAKVIYEDDREFQRQEDLYVGLRSILGNATITAIENELPALLAEPATRDAAIRRIRESIRKDFNGDIS